MEAGDHHNHTEVTREELFRPHEPSIFNRFAKKVCLLFEVPVVLFHDQVVEKVRKPYPYYHKRYQRVPTIDQCRIDDLACVAEANRQFNRDRLVDLNIVQILRNRKAECQRWYNYEREDIERFCGTFISEYEEAAVNYYIKYGELHWSGNVINAFMKQKHRMLWEKRNGPIGGNKKKKIFEAAEKETEEKDTLTKIYELGYRHKVPKEIRI
ncbi:unnamed protein product [Heterobilharzia americana]|nr:unnamed protein product [Heterobilharzia americana]